MTETMTGMNKVILGAAILALAIVTGLVVVNYVGRDQPPPLGSVDYAAAIPPGASVERTPQPYCHPDVPGWSAVGMTDMTEAELVSWYTDKYGPIDNEVSGFFNAALDVVGPGHSSVGRVVFGDLAVIYRKEPTGATWFNIRAYDTASHSCTLRSFDLWDREPVTASSLEGICGQVIEFYGVEFGTRTYGEGASEVADPTLSPPDGWQEVRYDDGRRIAWSLHDASRIYADPGDGSWHEYNRDNLCYID